MSVPEVLIFDLFGTLVFFDDSRIPTMEVAGRRVPMTVPGLDDHLGRFVPGVEVAVFLRELRAVSASLAEQKLREGIELHTSLRFERALLNFGSSPAAAAEGAGRMAALHMDSLAKAVVCPPGRVALLQKLAENHRLALLSNFDDGATARRVLAEAGLDRYFESIMISEEEGLRKPSRILFERACANLGAAPSSCLYVGDTLVEDIEGATGAGLAAVWVHPDEGAVSPASGVIADVERLPAWLASRGFSGRGAASR